MTSENPVVPPTYAIFVFPKCGTMYLLSSGFLVVSLELVYDEPVVVFTSFEESVKTKLKRLKMGSNRKSSPSPRAAFQIFSMQKIFFGVFLNNFG